ncbi:M1 family aminopeptidase [Olivibacter ginsenosidimutans]|uniref:Aminopeptidase N n=2 Tax=Olivibacter ginsenosidimutans TaxID=1176537 RepID=A0ABP9BPL5_9SPHI
MPDPGIAKELANYRKKQLSDIIYRLHFTIPVKKEDPILAEEVVEVRIHAIQHPLYMDFNEGTDHLVSLEVNGKKVAIKHEQEHLIVATEHLNLGKNTIHIQFKAGELSLNRNEDFLYTLLVPDRASTLFPCFDQPDLKAIYQLSITAPNNWKVLAGAAEVKQENKGILTQHDFEPTAKISTYLFSFVAGKFSEASDTSDRLNMHMLYRETDTAKIKNSIPQLFKLHRQAIAYLKDYTASPFPFQKLDFASIPAFQYGGMEHVGAIQYKESSLFLDETATASEELNRAKLIAHETAHMWFGDLVTMQWFNDVWMKEVFANFMADKIVNPAFPTTNHDLVFLLNHYPSAYSEDRTLGTNPIRQPLDNLKNAGSLYGNIIYDKAPIMMRQLELLLGKEKFRKGVISYLKKYAYANATWNDLIALWDEETTENLKNWSEVWVNASSRPIFSDRVTYDEKNRIQSFTIQQQAEDGSAKIWPQQFDIALLYPDSIQLLPIKMDGASLAVKSAIGLPKPAHILYNFQGLGYGVFPVKAADLAIFPTLKDDVARAYSFINTYEAMLNGSINPEETLNLYLQAIHSEKNELLVRLITGYTQTIFWTFLHDAQRQHFQTIIAQTLWKVLQGSASSNSKKSAFNLFCAVAYPSNEREKLYRIWKKELVVPGLRLNVDDTVKLASNLAIYQHPEAATILKQTGERIQNPDKRRQFEFLLPALAADEQVRNQFFNTLRNPKNREKESWVLEALANLNHPLRQKQAIKYLPTALELVEDIQRTGDIFFPKAWLVNTVGQYHSKQAYAIVEHYLNAHQHLDPTLRNKILQASDNLRRVR